MTLIAIGLAAGIAALVTFRMVAIIPVAGTGVVGTAAVVPAEAVARAEAVVPAEAGVAGRTDRGAVTAVADARS
jgi:hypothetical protein